METQKKTPLEKFQAIKEKIGYSDYTPVPGTRESVIYEEIQQHFFRAIEECENLLQGQESSTKEFAECLQETERSIGKDYGNYYRKWMRLLILNFPPDKIPDDCYNFYGPLFLLSQATLEKKFEIFLDLKPVGQARILALTKVAMECKIDDNWRDEESVEKHEERIKTEAETKECLVEIFPAVLHKITIERLVEIFAEIKSEETKAYIMQQFSAVEKLELWKQLPENLRTVSKELWRASLFDVMKKDGEIPDSLKGEAFGLLPEDRRTRTVYESLPKDAKKTAAKYLPKKEVPSKIPFYLTVGLEVLFTAAVIAGIVLCCTGVGAEIGVPLLLAASIGTILGVPYIIFANESCRKPANKIKKYKQEASQDETTFEMELEKFRQTQTTNAQKKEEPDAGSPALAQKEKEEENKEEMPL